MYYPKSQITPNLYTNGKELKIFTTDQPYVGDYYTISNGNSFIGKSPSSTPTQILLVPIETPVSSSSPSPLLPDVITLSNDISIQESNYSKSVKERYIPKPSALNPTLKDYLNNLVQRYFCKRNNQNLYFEINNKTYTDLRNLSPLVAFELYTPINISWLLVGDKEQVFLYNKSQVSLKSIQLNLLGFSSYFKNDYTKYHLEI
tara:strand:- start:272 stop:880 length:609 start_codon:yes stop_codon:yes gene_type:complete